jgi:hypothetical protein
MTASEYIFTVLIITLLIIEFRNTARYSGLMRLLSDFACMVGDLLDDKEN